MKCERCGNVVNENDKFCMCCGNKIAKDIIEPKKIDYNENKNTNEQQNNTNYAYNNYQNDEKLLRLYIGNNYDKISNKGFNFPALFLGNIYLLYRKCYLYFFLVLLATFFFPFSGLIAAIFFGIKFNDLYIKKAQEDIMAIKNVNQSPDIIERLVIAKGGTNLVWPILFAIIPLIFLTILIIIIVFLYIITKNVTTVSKYSDIYPDTYNTETQIREIIYDIPNDYNRMDYVENLTDSYIYSSEETCSVEISITPKTEEEYFSQFRIHLKKSL